jgi:hypothetical protein
MKPMDNYIGVSIFFEKKDRALSFIKIEKEYNLELQKLKPDIPWQRKEKQDDNTTTEATTKDMQQCRPTLGGEATDHPTARSLKQQATTTLRRRQTQGLKNSPAQLQKQTTAKRGPAKQARAKGHTSYKNSDP